MNRGQLLILLGGVVLIIGALLPWVSVTAVDGTVITGGYEGDRRVAGAFGAILLIGALVRKAPSGQRYFIVGSILALIIGAITVYTWVNFSTFLAAARSGTATIGDLVIINGSPKPGIYVSLIGSVVALIGGLLKAP